MGVEGQPRAPARPNAGMRGSSSAMRPLTTVTKATLTSSPPSQRTRWVFPSDLPSHRAPAHDPDGSGYRPPRHLAFPQRSRMGAREHHVAEWILAAVAMVLTAGGGGRSLFCRPPFPGGPSTPATADVADRSASR